MATELLDVAVPALSAAGGAGMVGWLLRMSIQRHLAKTDEMGKTLHAIAIQLRGIEVQMAALQGSETESRQQAVVIAVLQSQLAKAQADINGIGYKMRRGSGKEGDEE